MPLNIARIVEDLAAGKFVLIYDGDKREAEVDMAILGEFVTPNSIFQMRHDAGGLICTSLGPKLCELIELPFLKDILANYSASSPILEKMVRQPIPYGERSAFSIAVNHCDTFTGITDKDRAKTINELAKFGRMALDAEQWYTGTVNTGRGGGTRASASARMSTLAEAFASSFRIPGHVFLLRAAEGLLQARKGHTEMTAYLATLGNLVPVVAICEMMDGETGLALSLTKVERYAKKHRLNLLNGMELLDFYTEHEQAQVQAQAQAQAI
jgi:3,4-dihydroxy 2-butanone 4-phosphate synthase